MDKWNEEFKKHFHKKFHKFSKEIYVQLVAVACELKLSYLFDLFIATYETFNTFLQNIQQIEDFDNSFTNLTIIPLDGELFICNIISAGRILNGETFAKFVDVSKTLNEPIILEMDCPVIQEIRETFEDIVKRGFDLENKEKIINLNKRINKTSIYGLFLNFPIIYWFNDDDNENGGNCLNYKPLINIKIIFNYFNAKYCIYSFTYPQSLEQQCKVVVEKWLDVFKSTFYLNNLNFEYEIFCASVVLPCVNM